MSDRCWLAVRSLLPVGQRAVRQGPSVVGDALTSRVIRHAMRSRACAAQEEDAATAAKAAKEHGGSAAQDQPGGRHSRGRSDSQAPAVHWWQNPQAAFGPGDPVANAAAQQRDAGLSNDASKPPRPLSGQPGSKHSRCACVHKGQALILVSFFPCRAAILPSSQSLARS